MLDECEMIDRIWERGKDIFRKQAMVKRLPTQTIERLPSKPYKNAILNRIWELFPRFLMWEIWIERNRRIFEGK